MAIVLLVTTAATSLGLVCGGSAGAVAPHPSAPGAPTHIPGPELGVAPRLGAPPHPGPARSHTSAPKLGPPPDIEARVSATLVVDTEADTNPGDPATACASGNDHTCSLRAAVAVANGTNGVDAITVPSGYTVTLSLGPIFLSNSMVIDGNGATVNGANAQIFYEDGYYSATVQIVGLTLTDGYSTYGGGIQLSAGSLVLTDATVSDCSAGDGGALFAYDATLWVDGSTVSANAALQGAAMYLDESTVRIEGSTIGGASPTQANVGQYGAGIVNYLSGVLILNSTISYNSSESGYAGEGVGIYNQGNMEISGSTIDHNVLQFGGQGAGIQNVYELTVSDTSIDDDSSSGEGSDTLGTGLFNDGYATFTNVTMDGTQATGDSVEGGAVYCDAYGLTWTGGDIADTTNVGSTNGSISGGAIDNAGGTSTLHDVSISDTDDAAGAVDGGVLYNQVQLDADGLSITGTTVAATNGDGTVDGGGIDNVGGDVSTYTDTQVVGISVTADRQIQGGLLDNSQVMTATDLTLGGGTVVVTGGPDADDPAAAGAIAYSSDGLTLVNGTLDTVVSSVAGAGAQGLSAVQISGGSARFTNTTIADDSVSGPPGATALVAVGGGSLSLLNTIVDSTTPAANCRNEPGGTLVSLGHNLDSGTSCGFTQPGDLQNSDPEVATLADNGGSVETGALEPGSPAIGAGTDDGCPATDARGVARPQGDTCDIGAYEYQPAPPGYRLVASDGGIFAFGDAAFDGSMGGQHLNAPIVGVAATPDGEGYWEVASDGGIFSFGDAAFYGSMGGQHLNAPIVGIAATGDGRGYWEVASDGGIFSFGDAAFYGSMGGQHLNAPIVGIAARPGGDGYWEVAADGGIFSFGAATFYGSTGGQVLNAPIVGIATTQDGNGYWEVAADGGIFSFGDATFYGSMGGQHLNQPVVGMAATQVGQGYWEVAADGGIFSFGDATYEGSTGGITLNKPVVGMAGS